MFTFLKRIIGNDDERDWRLIRVCSNCKSKRVNSLGYIYYCKECGETGAQPVLQRKINGKFEYKQFNNYVNPLDEQ